MNLDDLPEINMEDELYDLEDIEEGEYDEEEELITTDAPPFPAVMRVLCEDDIVGVPASIVYHNSLKQLVQYLNIPVRACTAMDWTTKQRCGAPKPFEVVVRQRGTAAVVEWVHFRHFHISNFLVFLCRVIDCNSYCLTINVIAGV